METGEGVAAGGSHKSQERVSGGTAQMSPPTAINTCPLPKETGDRARMEGFRGRGKDWNSGDFSHDYS